MLFPDSPLASIQSQAVIEFDEIKADIPEDAICALPKSYAGRIIRLFSREVLMTKFKAIKYLEEIENDDKEGSICLFLPNDDEFARYAIPYLQKLPNYKIWVLVSPRDGPFFDKEFLEKNNFGDRLNIIEFHNDLLLLGEYLFLSNAPRCFKRIFIDGDIDDLTAVARTLTKIQIINGSFNAIYSYGDYSAKVKNILEEQKAQIGPSSFSSQSVYDTLIILDRTVDIASPLLTQRTFAGAIDDLLDIDCGIMAIPEDMDISQSEYILSDADPAFKETMSLQIKDVPTYITRRIQEVKESIQNRKSGEIDMEFKQKITKAMAFVNNMPLYENMFKVCDYIVKKRSTDPYFGQVIDYDVHVIRGESTPPSVAEAHIVRDQNWSETLREFCLASLCTSGIPSSAFEAFIIRLIQKFGLEVITDLVNLRSIGMMNSEEKYFEQIKNLFKNIIKLKQNTVFELYKEIPKELLIEDRIKDESLRNEINQKLNNFMAESFKSDIYEFFDGYAPFSARLVQKSIDHRLGKYDKQKQLKVEQYLQENQIKFEYQINPNKKQNVEDNKKVIVFIIGGISLSEVSAISDLAKKFWGGKQIEITVGSTSILTGKRLIRECVPRVAKADIEQPIVV
ncbi:Sec1 family protein [Trichomonas vaginalis G3]|uniref:Sec1 family protein n=1 Tax=Trichomonas vaginalis (strain ATCC PRA-98 / G3) TaxID=412133 RepID=A2ES05_TRIV3|nr:vesicle docking involved in exocytosis [Trichomonas vaginalis G3]EAY04600.1 Sec1 family protein [Trichomonas vaginalis G3]KAI5516100.1 vesicle docking involved in exocytosis [Trichomonas vaginalis G3]|eukprot:XP_001316823.1 Sec1 family protein [Trichomonas vaginalis G3]